MSTTPSASDDRLYPKHGGYKKLKSYQIAQLVYDVTVRFCERFVDKNSRTKDQMVQAARSGVQNIAEGSYAAGTSKKSEIFLTNVARASLEELRLDYQDFSRHNSLPMWPWNDVRRRALIGRRYDSADGVAAWVKEEYTYGLVPRANRSRSYSRNSGYAEISANAALALIAVASNLLDKQLEALARQFGVEGGFSERMYNFRIKKRDG